MVYHPTGPGRGGKEAIMRRIGLSIIVLVAATSSVSTPASADNRWCALSARGSENCGYSSFEQCQAAASGITRLCRPNPFPGSNYGSPAGSWDTAERARR
jgi:hypothetical protein